MNFLSLPVGKVYIQVNTHSLESRRHGNPDVTGPRVCTPDCIPERQRWAGATRPDAPDLLETPYAAHCVHQPWLPSLDEILAPTSLCSLH